MARVLYWNIKNFTDARINAKKRKREPDDDDFDAAPPGHQVLDAIVDTLSLTAEGGVPVQLDFIMVVEVCGTGNNPAEGDLVDGEGRTGCLTLLASIRANLPGGVAWMLVPPVVTGAGGKREAVAVYYRSDRWHFLGPLDRGAAYPAAFNGTLPGGNIPAGYPFRAGQPFNRGTGQRLWANPAGANVLFPGAADRKPWMTAFGDAANANNLIRLFGVHTSPNRPGIPSADQATANFALPRSIATRPADAANQIDAIVGDFNVSNVVAANFAAGGPYWGLMNLAQPFTPLIRPPAGLLAQYNSYYHTHGRPSGSPNTTIINDLAVPPAWDGDYPGLEYSELSVDNVFVRYRGGAVAPADHHTTILARARQQPYQAPAGPPAVMPMRGYFESVVLMESTMGELMHECTTNPAWQLDDINRQFREWNNYGRLYSISDHFPILFDI